MNGLNAITDGLRRLEDRTEITDLIHRYALYIRSGRSDEIHDLFTEDGEFRVRQTDPLGDCGITERLAHAGRQAIAGYFAGSKRPGTLTVPMVRNILIDLDGDTATSTCLMTSRIWPASANVMGEYHDTFRRTDRWRFSSRIFTVFSQPTAPSP